MSPNRWYVNYFESSVQADQQERHSILGVFLRRLLLQLRKLSFDETSQLARQIGQWCGSGEGSSRIHVSSLNRRLAMDDSLDKRTSAMQQ
jgi:anaphase-promoting complex subunit 5